MKNKFILLSAILLFGFFFRYYNLAKNPPGFYADEASIGFNAYSILQSGHDEHGQFMPLFFKAFGEYKNAFAIYPAIPFIFLFGLTEKAVRLAQVVFGILDIFAIYFLGKELWNKKFGLLSAFILASAPWHIHISRFIIESHNAFLLFTILGLFFTLKAFRKKLPFHICLPAIISWSCAFYTYFATRVFTPVVLIFMSFIYLREIFNMIIFSKKKFLLYAVLFLFLLSPFFFHMAHGEGFIRFHQLTSGYDKPLQSIIYEKIQLYYEHFHPDFVFKYGDSDYVGQNIVRHSINGIGLFYRWLFPFFVIGIFVALGLFFTHPEKRKQITLVIAILIIYPLGTLVSNAQTPYATRSFIGVLPYTLLTGCGLYVLTQIPRFIKIGPQFMLSFFLSLLILFPQMYYTHRFTSLMNTYMNRAYGYNGFQWGVAEIIGYYVGHQREFDALLLDEGMDGKDAYIRFYTKGKCSACYTNNDSIPQSAKRILIATSPDYENKFKDRYSLSKETSIVYNGRAVFSLMRGVRP